jgi:hypothetical protein
VLPPPPPQEASRAAMATIDRLFFKLRNYHTPSSDVVLKHSLTPLESSN